ncbi:MAG: hypothetical protein ACI8VT_003309 [Saprospiraceae bacterium]|jgi:hypothetical protein
MRLFSFLLFFCLILTACTNDPISNYQELDLMQYGVPLKIMAPDSADVKKEDWISQQGVTVKKDDYEVQIWSSQASTPDVATLKANKLAEVKSNRLFSKVIQENSDGFIFENKLDSLTRFYGFYHLVIQGDHEYTFQNGLRGNFTLAQVENMYKAVKPETED